MGAGVIVKVISSEVLPQGELPVTLRVKITEPLLISSVPGVYVGVKVVPSVKVPSPGEEAVQFNDE